MESTARLDPDGVVSGTMNTVPVHDRACSDCRRSYAAKKTSESRFCGDCRTKRKHMPKKYRWTPEQDALLRAQYDGRKGCGIRLSRSIGYPRRVVVERAQVLGLGFPRKHVRAWTPEEDDFLETHCGEWTVHKMARHLKRTRLSVAARVKRLRLSAMIHSGYTLESLKACFNVCCHVVTKWIDKRMLRGKRRYNCDANAWHFTDDDVLRFIRNYPNAFKLARVDQTWFIDLVLGIRTDAREVA